MSVAPTHFVLDHNFPYYVTGFAWPSHIRVSRLADIDPALVQDHEDWEVLRALDARGGIAGFITNDGNMLMQAPEMIALSQSRLALVATDGVGHEPIRATGLIMVHLQQVSKIVDGKPRIVRLAPAQLKQTDPWTQLNVIAQHANAPVAQLVREERARMEAQHRLR